MNKIVSVKQILRDSGLFKEHPTSSYVRFTVCGRGDASIFVQPNSKFDIREPALERGKFPNSPRLHEFASREGRIWIQNDARIFRLESEQVGAVVDIIRDGLPCNSLRESVDDGRLDAQGSSSAASKTLNTIFYGPPGTGRPIRPHGTAWRPATEALGCRTTRFVIAIGSWSTANGLSSSPSHQSYGYEEFVEGLRPSPSEDGQGSLRLEATPGVLKRIADRARKHQESRYVLVIDEINRANVSKVMGELITLLEEDKREGAEHEVAVTLPHSGERFTLPQNLYILGTMNTADRSIALIDTALRRRFEFDEIAPKPELLKVVERINLPDVLEAINERLEYLIDRDHLIGHAWLMNAGTKGEVDRIMRRKIIPLIAEYFYDDWRKVRAVLGNTDHFVRSRRLARPPGLDEVDMDERHRWTVREKFSDDAYDSLVSGRSSAPTAPADGADG